MSTVHLKLGPTDHDRPLTLDDFESAEFEPGFKYEIIDGRLAVAPEANLTENVLEDWLYDKLKEYAKVCPAVINYVTNKARVFIPSRDADTCPEPDIAAYKHFPHDILLSELRWEDVSPILVAEVLVECDSAKDLVRNPGLYADVPSIQEYWVLDGRVDPDEPTLHHRRRRGKRWVVRDYPYGSTFTTKLLPGFALLIDPRK
jgi:Uma2 family endonuclease